MIARFTIWRSAFPSLARTKISKDSNPKIAEAFSRKSRSSIAWTVGWFSFDSCESQRPRRFSSRYGEFTWPSNTSHGPSSRNLPTQCKAASEEGEKSAATKTLNARSPRAHASNGLAERTVSVGTGAASEISSETLPSVQRSYAVLLTAETTSKSTGFLDAKSTRASSAYWPCKTSPFTRSKLEDADSIACFNFSRAGCRYRFASAFVSQCALNWSATCKSVSGL